MQQETRKVTVRLPKDLLEQAMAYTGLDVTETIILGLEKLVEEYKTEAADQKR